MEELIISVPKDILEQIDDVLRMYVADEHCELRKSCRDRQTMLAYNMTQQLLHTGKYVYDVSHILGYKQKPIF